MIRRIIILSTTIFLALTISAGEKLDSAFIALYRHYYQLYDTDSIDEFYKVSELIQQKHLKNGDMNDYYVVRQNEILYDAEHGEAYKAIKKANALLEEMENANVKQYHLVYSSLGNIFESRGNYRTAVHYYMEAIDNIELADSASLAQVYAQLATINTTYDIAEAWQWNERLASIVTPKSLYYKLYLLNKGEILFFKGDREHFFENKYEWDRFSTKYSSIYRYGEYVMEIMDKAFLGKYDEALQLLDQKSQDYDIIRRCDIRIQIYKMMGHPELALQEIDVRRDLRDSLNNSLIFDNINEINTAAGIAKLNDKTAKERELWLGTVVVLLFVALGLSISRYFSRQHYQRKILKQNEQLEIALDEAKESERMKNIFIQHISHEIRTPLNVITGYAQVITNPAFELEKEERDNMLQAIGKNTVAITDIVNDLLEISQEESKERYRRDDNILVNDFCRQIMTEAEKKNMGRLKLNFNTTLPDHYAMRSNQNGIERIIQHLLNNAMKFTEKGQIELSVYESDDENSMHFAVADTGVGIPEERHEQVFEHFYKLDSFKQGLGIGLSMSRKIAILLGGTLAIDKNYHDGTRMVLTVPAK